MTLVAEVSRYLNLSPLGVEELLDATKEGTGELVAMTNEFNELLYDEIIPRLFRLLFDLDESQKTEEHEVELIEKFRPADITKSQLPKTRSPARWKLSKRIVARASISIPTALTQTLSKHCSGICCGKKKVKKIYFTGMLTHGQTDFFIQYIDPDSHTVRSYYPDFLFLREQPDGTEKYVIVEVKADNQIDDSVVQAKKEFAQQIAVASGMEYQIIKASDAQNRHYRILM